MRRAGERVGARLRLREGDHLSDVVLAGEDRDQTVDAEREAGVRWRAVAEGVEEEPEALVRLLGVDPEQAEHRALEVRRVDTDTPRSELPAVQHEVVVLRAHVEHCVTR